jgi:UDP-N-acetyl-D-glucosamine dehydrogenase
MTAEFIELAGKVNQNMPYHCVARIERVLNDAAKAVRGSRIAVFGVSYKAGVGDIRESPALKIIEVLTALGADVVYHDPHVPELPEHGLRAATFDEAMTGADLAVIVTAHPTVDHAEIVDRAPLALDLRGVTRRRTGEPNAVPSL